MWISRRQQHEPTTECHRDHCYSHMVDEPVDGRPYHLACGECLHLFRTRWNLWADHLRVAARLHWADITAPRRQRDPSPADYAWAAITSHLNPTVAHRRAAALRRLALLPFTRPSRIYTCPHCVHDL